MTTGTSFDAELALMRRQTSYPSMPGICTSSKIRSGGDALIAWSALSPSSAVRTRHSTPARHASISSRFAAPSSTTNTTGVRSGWMSRRVAGTLPIESSPFGLGHAAGLRAATKAAAVGKRSSGRFARARRRTSSMCAESSPRSSRVDGIGLVTCDRRTAAGVSAPNGTRPVNIS